MKLSTVNVISSSTRDGTVNHVNSFSDDEVGNKEAEKKFARKAKDFGCPEEDISAATEDGFYVGHTDSVYLVHTT